MRQPKLAVFAGSGDLPGRIVSACREIGRDVFVLAFEGVTDADAIGDAVEGNDEDIAPAFMTGVDDATRQVARAGEDRELRLTHGHPLGGRRRASYRNE